MSTAFRSLRTAAARASRSSVQPVRRYASAHGEYKKSSDVPWILGSAAVFVPLGAYVVNDLRKLKTESAHGHGHDDHGHGAVKHAKESVKHVVNEVTGSDSDEEKSEEQAIKADGDPAEAKKTEEDAAEASGPEGAVPSPDASAVGKSAQPQGSDAPAARSPDENPSDEQLEEAKSKDAGGNDPLSGSDPSRKETSRDKIQLARDTANPAELHDRVTSPEEPRLPKNDEEDSPKGDPQGKTE